MNTLRAAHINKVLSEDEYLLSTIKEKGFTPQNINRWNKDNYFLKPTKTNTWAKYSFLDYVWIKVLVYMSDLGVTKKNNFKRETAEKDNVDKIIHCLAAVPSESNQSIPAEITDPMKQAAYRTLITIVVDSLLTKSQYQLRLVKEGICQLWRNNILVEPSDAAGYVSSKSFVQIAFSDIFIDFVTGQIIAGSGKDLMWKGLLRNPEGTLVEHLKYGVVDSLVVEAVDGMLAELPVDQEITEETARQLANYMFLGQYNKMTYVISGTTSSFSTKEDELA